MQSSIVDHELKFPDFLYTAPLGLMEIDESGLIVQLNPMAEALLKPIRAVYSLATDNFFPIVERINPTIVERIQQFTDDTGIIILNELFIFELPLPGETAEKHFNIVVNKAAPEHIIVILEDFSPRRLEEKRMLAAEQDKAIAQSKFEIASDILHDIGNAIVGFGSYLTRIRRSIEQDQLGNLQNLSLFLNNQREALAGALGADKAEALVTLLNGMAETHKIKQEEIRQSVLEQSNIISHIQDILAIQRQYVTSGISQDRKPVNLRNIINDCLSMLFASLDKRQIIVSLSIEPEHPVIKGDRTNLMQVILNLLKNSIEAIDIRSVERVISIELKANTQFLVLTVQDSGDGFDETVKSKLFNRGFTTKETGSGLGLYNCKTIIESHAGTIDLTSPGPGKGSTVTIKFIV